MNEKSILPLLERIRSIAQLGLTYSKDPYDRDRYEQLLELACAQYESLSGIPSEDISDRFRRDLGHVTSKVGVNAAIFSEDGRLFLTRRVDDRCWELPGGWVDAGEAPEEAIAREMREEIAAVVTVRNLVGVFSRCPGDFGQPHSSCHLVYHCEAHNFAPKVSSEVSDVQFIDSLDGISWHRDHFSMATAAIAYYTRLLTERATAHAR